MKSVCTALSEHTALQAKARANKIMRLW